jgi:hypothetical protein
MPTGLRFLNKKTYIFICAKERTLMQRAALDLLGSSVALAAGDTNVSNVRRVHSTTPVQKKGNRGPTAPLSVQIVSPSRAD